jgi:hypothetical protein
MRLSLAARLLLLTFVLASALLVRGSATAALPAVEMPLSPGSTLPWAMTGCWEHELFIPEAAAPVVN